MSVAAIPQEAPEYAFHRNRTIDKANPWQRGMVEPTLPPLSHKGDDKIVF